MSKEGEEYAEGVTEDAVITPSAVQQPPTVSQSVQSDTQSQSVMAQTQELPAVANPAIHAAHVSANQYPVMMAAPHILGKHPGRIMCKHCGRVVFTRTDRRLSAKQIVCAYALCSSVPCVAPLPLIMDSMKDTVHRCSLCNRFIQTVMEE